MILIIHDNGTTGQRGYTLEDGSISNIPQIKKRYESKGITIFKIEEVND